MAEGLNRKWKTFELSKEYTAASVFRFIDNIDDSTEYYNKLLNTESTVEL